MGSRRVPDRLYLELASGQVEELLLKKKKKQEKNEQQKANRPLPSASVGLELLHVSRRRVDIPRLF